MGAEVRGRNGAVSKTTSAAVEAVAPQPRPTLRVVCNSGCIERNRYGHLRFGACAPPYFMDDGNWAVATRPSRMRDGIPRWKTGKRQPATGSRRHLRVDLGMSGSRLLMMTKAVWLKSYVWIGRLTHVGDLCRAEIRSLIHVTDRHFRYSPRTIKKKHSSPIQCSINHF